MLLSQPSFMWPLGAGLLVALLAGILLQGFQTRLVPDETRRLQRRHDDVSPFERNVDTVLDPSCQEMNFEASLLVEVQESGAPTVEELELLETGFEHAYLTFRCIRGDRQISRVAIMQDDNNNSTNTNDNRRRLQTTEARSVQVVVTGTCRGCQTDNFSLFGQGALVRKVPDARRLQGNTCSCDGPTVTGFLETYNNEIATFRSMGMLQNIDSVDKATELREVNCSSNITFFETNVFLDIRSQEAIMLTGQDISDLETVFRDTYNQLNGLDSQVCDRFFREVQEAVFVADSTFNRRCMRELQMEETPSAAPSGLNPIPPRFILKAFLFRLLVRGRCRGCARDANLFDDGVTLQRTLQEAMKRKLAEITSERILQSANNTTMDQCFCPVDSQDRPPTSEEFGFALNQSFSQISALASANATLGQVIEVDPVDCPTEVDEFQSVIRIQFFGFPADVSEEESSLLEFAIGRTYNEISQTFCDPSFRTIDRAGLISQESSRLNASASMFVRNYQVTGRCRGCSPETDLFDDVAVRLLRGEERSGIRSLQDTGDQCFCSTRSVADRTQSTAEFSFAYNATLLRWVSLGLIKNVTSIVDVFEQTREIPDTAAPTTAQPFITPFPSSTSPSSAPSGLNSSHQTNCSANLTFFDTNVFVDIRASDVPMLSTQDIADLENIFADTYNQLNQPSNQVCDSFFRVIEDVVFFADSDFNRRHLRELQTETVPSAAPSETVFIPPRLILRSFFFRLLVRGRCRGCALDANIFDDRSTIQRALQQVFDQKILNEGEARYLQAVNSTDSCTCPAGAEDRTPTTEEFRTSFNESIQQVNGLAAINGSVANVIGVDPVDCSAQVNEFESTLAIEFLGFPSGLSQGETDLLEFAVARSYNEIALTYCDPNFRTIMTTEILPLSMTLASRYLQTQAFNATPIRFVRFFRVNGRCRGCIGGTSLFNDASGRFLEEEDSVSMPRRLEDVADQCFCSSNSLGERAQSALEFGSTYNTTLSRWVGLGLIENVTSVLQVAEPSSTPTLSIQPSRMPMASPPFASPVEPPLAGPTTDILEPSNMPSFETPSSPEVPSSGPSSMKSSIQPSPAQCPRLNFDVRLLVEFSGTVEPSQDELLLVANEFIQAYDVDCPFGTRTIDAVNFELDPASSVNRRLQQEGSTSIVYRVQVTGFCVGCVADTFTLFLMTPQDTTRSRKTELTTSERRLQEDCDCPGLPLVSFVSTLNGAVSSLASQGQISSVNGVMSITELEPISCSNNITSFQTYAVVDFLSEVEAIDTSLEAVAQDVSAFGFEFAQVYNSLNVLNDEFCDPLFRVVDSVAFSGVGVRESQRSLQETTPSTSPLFDVALRFSIVGQCRGCGPETNLFEDIGLRRRVQSATTSLSSKRRLQLNETETCFCPPGVPNATVQSGAFAVALNNSIVALTGVLAEVNNVLELDAVPCSQSVASFTTGLSFQVSGLSEDISEVVREILSQTILESYNALASTFFCDEVFRVVEGTDLKQIVALSDDSVELIFRVQARCRGCQTGTLLFPPGRRQLKPGQWMLGRRRLQVEECFCATNAVPGAPPLTQFIPFVNEVFVRLEVTNVLSSTVVILEGAEVEVEPPTVTTPVPSVVPTVETTTTSQPSLAPTAATTTTAPSSVPTELPTTSQPSLAPTAATTTTAPSSVPTELPTTAIPSRAPTTPSPSLSPTILPSALPTGLPTPMAASSLPSVSSGGASPILTAPVPPSPGFPPCSICGEGSRITSPMTLLQLLDQDPITCARLQQAGDLGFIEEAFCPFLAGLAVPCNCAPGTVPEVTISPPTANTLAPTVLTIGIGVGNWVQVGDRLTGSDASLNEFFGRALALSSDGSTVAIGARAGAGKVLVYDLSGDTWVIRPELSLDPGSPTEFGTSVALSGVGLTLAVGAPNGFGGQGFTYVYEFDEVWTLLGEPIPGAAGERFGASIDMTTDGGRVAVGAPGATVNGNVFVGTIRVFGTPVSGSSAWLQLGQDMDGFGMNGSFGASISISGEGSIVAAGAPDGGGVNGLGYVSAFVLSGNSWAPLGQRIEPVSDFYYFGTSIDLSSSGLNLVVGARNDGELSDLGGTVRLYDYDASSQSWVKIAPDLPNFGLFDETGTTVSVSSSGRTIAVGRAGANDFVGRATTYRWNSQEWLLIGGDLEEARDGNGSGSFGRVVVISSNGNKMAVSGSPDYVQVYEIR